MDTAFAIAFVWFAILLLLMRWSWPYEFWVRSLPTTYFPHPSHFVLRLYLALTVLAFVIGFAHDGAYAGALILLLFFLWHLWMALKLLWGLLRGIDIHSAD